MIEKGQRIKAQDVKQGLTTWDPNITYQKNATCYYEDEDNNIPYALYRNLTGTNNPLANPAQDTINWEELEFGGGGGGLEIGDIGIVTLPIKEEKLKRRYLNGQLILQSEFVAFTRKLKSAIQTYPNLVCTEQEWQATVTASKVGQCGKFVVDDVNGTIRLPKVVRIQGQLTLANIGDIIDESLPDITGTTGVGSRAPFTSSGLSGAFYGLGSSLDWNGSGLASGPTQLGFDASRSSSTYQNGAVVQEEAVQYPYFIQLANGTEEEIDPVREIEFNNPFYFGLSKWSQTKIENLSWLLSDGEFKRGDVYVDFYDWILKNKSGAIDSGIIVKTTDETYDDYDFVVNETDGTFRTPLKTLEASGSRVIGNGITVGFTDGTNNSGLQTMAFSNGITDGGTLLVHENNYGKIINTAGYGGGTGTKFNKSKTLGLTTDPDKSGIETSSQDLFLYWYVGETVQNAHLINAANLMNSVTEYVDDLTEQTKTTMDELVAKVIDEGNKQWAKVNMEGLHIFDIVQKDHRLSFAESNGFAELGTWVWKEGVSDSRYGYPDFYDVCLAEYNNSTEGGYLASNIEKVGSVIDDLGVLSGFSTTSYAFVGNSTTTFSPANNTWEICLKITTGNNVSTLQYYFNFKDTYAGPIELYIESTKFKINISSNGTSDDIAYNTTGTYTVLANTTYWTKIIFDGTKYVFSYSLDGENFTDDITVTNSTVVLSGKIPTLGIDYNSSAYANPFLGSIDLTQCYIKIANEYWWKGIRQARINNNGHIYYDVADKDLVDVIYANTGNAWMYGIDTENERVFLPRKKHGKLIESHNGDDGWYRLYEDGWVEQGGQITKTGGQYAANLVPLLIQMLDNTYYANGIFSDGYSDTTATIGVLRTTTSITIYPHWSTTGQHICWEVKGYSSRTPSLMNYYMIVGSVKEETAIGQYTDVTTTENDTIPLFKDEYFEFIPEHISWAPANTIKDGNEYLTAYNQLVNLLNPVNNTKQLKVIDEDDMEAGVDYSEYWIVNQTNITFRTPITVSKKALTGAVKGNGMTLGLTDGTNNAAIFTSGDSRGDLMTKINAYGSNVGTPVDSVVDRLAGNKLAGVTTESSKSGIIAEQSTSLLYFKVGNAVQNLQLIDVGRLEENKASIDASNFNAIGKNTIISNGMPDYTAGIAVTTFPFTASVSGFIIGNADNSNINTTLYIDSVAVGYISPYNTFINLYIEKNSVLTKSGNIEGSNNLVFYPMKGAS